MEKEGTVGGCDGGYVEQGGGRERGRQEETHDGFVAFVAL